MTGGSMAVLGQKSLVTKIYFPREVLPIAYVTSSFVNMLLSFVVVFAVVLVAGVPVNPLGMLTLPLVMIVEYLMALGVAMTVSAITVYFRDLEHILGIISMGMQFLSPVMYNEVTMNITGRNLTLFKLNPMYYILSAYRTILYYGEVPDLKTLLPGLAFGVVMLLAGFRIFDVLKKRFAEVM
jgi:ABC-2 type transport system permease protein